MPLKSKPVAVPVAPELSASVQVPVVSPVLIKSNRFSTEPSVLLLQILTVAATTGGLFTSTVKICVSGNAGQPS